MNTYMPYVIEKGEHGSVRHDLFSKLMQERIIFLGSQIDDHTGNVIATQLLYLASEDPDADITMYINSPGGVITAGMAIFDTMNMIPCDVRTICIGQAASMGSFLLAAGTPGKRFALPNSTVMIHQPLGGARGQATDIEISARRILALRESLNAKLAAFTGQTLEKIQIDTERDYYMTAEEAVAYGMVDHLVEPKSKTDLDSQGVELDHSEF